MENYNIVWKSPSTRSADSMPLGGHDVGCNVWAEGNQLLLYLCQSGGFDENGCLLKQARLRLESDPKLMASGFRQTLHLNDGYISVELGSGENTLRYDLWCAVTKPELHIHFASSKPRKLTFFYDCWRYRDRVVTPEEGHQCRDYCGNPELEEGKVFTRKDTVVPETQSLLYYHRNETNGETLIDKLVKEQRAESFRDKICDCITNRTTGGFIRLDGFHFVGVEEGYYQNTDSRLWRYDSESATEGEIVLTMRAEQDETLQDWQAKLAETAAEPVLHESVKRWWNDYFEKSWIHIDESHPESDSFAIGRNYQLFRYMLGCNYYGKWPTKFNGGLFTFDEGHTPDYRAWSGTNHTAQNQRLVYWPMLKSGDFEAMKPQFEYYKRMTPVGQARTQHFYHHGGAYYFEQSSAFGLAIGMEYNWRHSETMDFGEIDFGAVRLHYSSGLEFALMVLEYHRYSGKDVSEYMDFVESAVEFYAQHYPIVDGKLFVFPSCALETYRGCGYSESNTRYGCANPTDAVAGLRTITAALVEYYQDNPEKKARFEYIHSILPEIAVGRDEDGEYYLPADSFDPTPFNCELPQLYPVFPYGSRGLTEQEKTRARNAYLRKFPSEYQYLGYSWHQNGIFAARLGLLDDAENYLHIKFDNATRRFPAFWGPGHDWTPDHNHGGSGMILLQEMLLQCEGTDEVKFLPTWPKGVDVSFRLFVPGGKVAECEYKNGEFLKKEVHPA